MSANPLPVAFFGAKQGDLLKFLKAAVRRETPSDDKQALDRFAAWLATELTDRGAHVEIHPRSDRGDHVQAIWGSGRPGVLLLTHYDTVHPIGSLNSMPWGIEDGRAIGPGVFDMKASLAMALTAITALREAELLPSGRVTLLSTSDEEIGSHSSRALLKNLARDHDVVLCLEPPLSDGSLKTWRKGVGAFELTARGRAAHAGVSPQTGVSAIHEMALQIPRILDLADADQGTTLNVGTITGGTRTNVVPEWCHALIDIRILEPTEQERIDRAMTALEPVLPGALLEVVGEWNRPPMPSNPVIKRTFEWAASIAQGLGMTVGEGGTGGASDANFVAPLGIPLLDGLGAVGGDAHASTEWVSVPELAPRTALLAALIQSALQEPPQPH